MPFRRPVLCAIVVSLLAGCATRSADVKPTPASAADFAGWPCDALADEAERVQQRAAEVAYAVDTVVGNNLIVLSIGTALFWPALLAMRPDGPDAAELARLKGRYEALQAAALERHCPPPGEMLSPRRAAALPVALGERLVYEERLAAGGPAREIDLKLQALKRGEFDFLLDRGPGSRASVWQQDAAGNAQAGQPFRFVTWTHFLHRDMALGDVLAGELIGPDTAERPARVRGQVIAVGPQPLLGRVFDVATIELFGDVPNGPAATTRVDGVMLVDRASGVLLRLELRSGNPEYALKRKLVRIDPAG